MPRIDAVVELRLAEDAIRRLSRLRFALTYSERLRVAELLRDCADEVDRGENPPDHPFHGCKASVG